jgi:uncharacterized membrane protein
MKDKLTPDESLIQKLAAGKIFRIVSLIQISIHFLTYIASFVKLIMIEAGGYYDVGIITFIGITLLSMPLFSIYWWLIQNSLKISKRQRFWGYCLHVLTVGWIILMIKLSYLM